MKIRNGFVSNSSSSSFVLVVRKERFDEVMKDQHPFVQAYAKAAGSYETALGLECFVLSGSDIHGECSYDYMDSFAYDGPDFEHKWFNEVNHKGAAEDTIVKLFTKDPDAFYHYEDM